MEPRYKRHSKVITIVREALRIKDSRLVPAMAVVFVCLAIDFFGRVVLFSPASSQLDIDQVVTLSEAIPQIDQPHLDNYLSNIAGLNWSPTQVESGLGSDELVVQELAIDSKEGFRRVGIFSYKLIALVQNAERFAVLYSLDNESGVIESIEVRQGDTIGGYMVSELLSKELRLTSENGDPVTLRLFEREEAQI